MQPPRAQKLRLVRVKEPGVLIYERGSYDEPVAEACSGNPFNFGDPVAGADVRRAKSERLWAMT